MNIEEMKKKHPSWFTAVGETPEEYVKRVTEGLPNRAEKFKRLLGSYRKIMEWDDTDLRINIRNQELLVIDPVTNHPETPPAVIFSILDRKVNGISRIYFEGTYFEKVKEYHERRGYWTEQNPWAGCELRLRPCISLKAMDIQDDQGRREVLLIADYNLAGKREIVRYDPHTGEIAARNSDDMPNDILNFSGVYLDPHQRNQLAHYIKEGTRRAGLSGQMKQDLEAITQKLSVRDPAIVGTDMTIHLGRYGE
ncbi:hypothetical protein JW968_02160 [Candidatus Woesearchaeota archaeon]|nr:hypothetical protein [Candidatus Woesearchaeota archaeon]